MGEQFQTANVKFCLQKIEELIEALQKKGVEDAVVKEKRELAERALKHLNSIFGYEKGIMKTINCKSHPFFD